MKPSDEIIEKFQRIYLEEYGEQLSEEEAYDNFMNLVNFLRVDILIGGNTHFH
jgi:hypothetical protein